MGYSKYIYIVEGHVAIKVNFDLYLSSQKYIHYILFSKTADYKNTLYNLEESESHVWLFVTPYSC